MLSYKKNQNDKLMPLTNKLPNQVTKLYFFLFSYQCALAQNLSMPTMFYFDMFNLI